MRPWKSLTGLTLLALLAHLPGLLYLEVPGTMDATYAFEVASNLATGRGLTEDFVWAWFRVPQAIPHPACTYWMPLQPWLMAAFMKIWGPAFSVARVPGTLMVALLPALAWLVGRRWVDGPHGPPWGAWTGFVLALFSGWTYTLATSTDSFGLFGALGATVLLLCARPTPGRLAWAAVLLGPAILTRIDGVWLGVPVAWAAWRGGPRARWATLLGTAAAGAMVIPWLLRNQALLGAPIAGRALFLRSYSDFFSADPQGILTLEGLVEWGPGPLAWSRLRGLGWALLSPYGVPGAFAVVFAPLVAWGAWIRRRDPGPFAPALLFAATLVGAGVLLYPAVLERGTLLHGLAPLSVFGGPLAGAGLRDLARRRNLHPGFLVALVALGAMLVSGVTEARLLATQRRTLDHYLSVAPLVGGGVIMTDDPIAWHHATGGPAIVHPWDDGDTVRSLARRFDATHLVLRPVHPPSLAPLWKQEDGAARALGLTLVRAAPEIQVWAWDVPSAGPAGAPPPHLR